VSRLFFKNFSPFRFAQISFIDSAVHPTEGRIAIVTDAGLDAMDADGATDESTGCGRRSRVVLTPRRWRQVRGASSAGDGDKKSPIAEESTKEAVKTIARGMPGDSGVT